MMQFLFKFSCGPLMVSGFHFYIHTFQSLFHPDVSVVDISVMSKDIGCALEYQVDATKPILTTVSLNLMQLALPPGTGVSGIAGNCWLSKTSSSSLVWVSCAINLHPYTH